jgi:hypothetical protein
LLWNSVERIRPTLPKCFSRCFSISKNSSVSRWINCGLVKWNLLHFLDYYFGIIVIKSHFNLMHCFWYILLPNDCNSII